MRLTGTPASKGIYTGRVKLVLTQDDLNKVREGDVLVACVTDPAFNGALAKCRAIVTDMGNILCHAAIVAREFRIPCVVGTRTATTTIPDGVQATVDGGKGTVSW